MKTKKVVINACYGGFGLSAEAVLYLIKKGSPLIEKHPATDWGTETYDKWEQWEDGFEKHTWMEVLRKDGTVYLDNAREDKWRTHPDLIDVVEALGPSKASGRHAELTVVTIPASVDYVIDEYDGVESIHEAHRSWS